MIKNGGIIILGFLLFSACGWLEEQEPLTKNHPVVVKAADERLKRYLHTKLEDCKEELLDEAESKVDSIITELIEEYIKDSTYFPAKPQRPVFPDKLKAEPDMVPKPIFDSLPSKIPGNVKDSLHLKDSLGIK